MKNSKILYLFAFLTVGTWLGNHASAQPGVAVSFQTFYNELSPYGRWTSHPQYGSIWTPYNVDRDFQPYATNGQWMMTEYGNTWVSDYDWGWAPFHYGRWFHDDFHGWAWVPDYEWGPAWVDWRSGGGYYGWAPLWPGVRVGVSFNIPFNFWVFVPQRYVYRPRVFGFCVYGNRYRNVYNQTTIINNYYRNDNRVYAYGPRRSEIEQATRGSVPVYRAEELRSSRYASTRQNSDGSYRANSESGLTRGNRDNSNATSNRSGRQSVEADNRGTSSRTYDADASSRSRGSYEAAGPSGSSRSYESSAPGTSSRSYESGEPSSRARSSASSPSSSTYSAPETRSSVESPASRARSSASSPSSSTYSTPETRSSSNSSSRSRSMESAPSRSSSSGYSQPSRSSSPRMEAPASRSRSSESAPRSNSSSNSSSSSSSSRSRGPR